MQNLKTVKDFIRYATSQFEQAGLFYGHGTHSAFDDAAYLVLEVLKLPQNIDVAYLDAALTEAEKTEILALIKQRVEKRMPTAYLVNRAWFASLPFYVDERVLVPRSPLSQLIMNDFSGILGAPPARVLDLCTGSGCIGIACGYVFPEAEVVLSDISADALAVANINIDEHAMGAQVTTVLSDGLSEVDGQFDLIITNPPYVDVEDMSDMPQEFHYEPELGLASGDDGLAFTHQLLKDAANKLCDGGVLIGEVGNSMYALMEAYPELDFYWPELDVGAIGVFVLTKAQLARIS